MIQPKIILSSEKKLVGKRLTMSLVDYMVAELWKSFMPRRKEINYNLNKDIISLAIYKPDYFKDFKPENKFEKWAAVEVASFDDIPAEMEKVLVSSGLYAVFNYKGLNTDHSIFEYIFGKWLPDSEYVLDDRPHFEVLGEKYKSNDPVSEEEIWIPIKAK